MSAEGPDYRLAGTSASAIRAIRRPRLDIPALIPQEWRAGRAATLSRDEIQRHTTQGTIPGQYIQGNLCNPSARPGLAEPASAERRLRA